MPLVFHPPLRRRVLLHRPDLPLALGVPLEHRDLLLPVVSPLHLVPGPPVLLVRLVLGGKSLAIHVRSLR